MVQTKDPHGASAAAPQAEAVPVSDPPQPAPLTPAADAVPGAYLDALCPWCCGRGLRYHAAPERGGRPWAVCVHCGRGQAV